MTEALPEPVRAAGLPVEVWHQDEARVGQQGTLTYVWADKGTRPAAPKDLGYEWVYLFGAICPSRGVGAALALPYANAAMMSLHRCWCISGRRASWLQTPGLPCDDCWATDGIWASNHQHPVQPRHADGGFGLLGRKAAGAQTWPDQRLVTTHCRFY